MAQRDGVTFRWLAVCAPLVAGWIGCASSAPARVASQPAAAHEVAASDDAAIATEAPSIEAPTSVMAAAEVSSASPAPAETTMPATSTPAPADVTAVPVIMHVATAAGAPVMDEAQLRSWLALADRHFAAAGIAFNAELRPLPEGFAELARIRDRRALKRFLVPHRINVFVVGRMLDPVASEATKRAAAWQGFTPSGKLAGAHIEADGKQPKTYLIVSATDGSGITLTHELGHFFGVAHHRDPENIMSYGAQRSRFEEAQLNTFRHKLRALLRGRVLR